MSQPIFPGFWRSLLASYCRIDHRSPCRSKSRRRRALHACRKDVGLLSELLEDRVVLATFVVNSVFDTIDANPGDGLALDATGNTTLRAAVMEANALAGDDIIELPAGTFPLTIAGADDNLAATGDLDITDSTGSLAIIGAGNETIIDASGLGDRVFHAVNSSVDAAFQGVVITGGTVTGPGGGIYFNGSELTIIDSTLTENHASGSGGALHATRGTITVTRSSLSSNQRLPSDTQAITPSSPLAFDEDQRWSRL